jgi:hypothetical protein
MAGMIARKMLEVKELSISMLQQMRYITVIINTT